MPDWVMAYFVAFRVIVDRSRRSSSKLVLGDEDESHTTLRVSEGVLIRSHCNCFSDGEDKDLESQCRGIFNIGKLKTKTGYYESIAGRTQIVC